MYRLHERQKESYVLCKLYTGTITDMFQTIVYHSYEHLLVSFVIFKYYRCFLLETFCGPFPMYL
jgi:hypothetical protein